MIGDLKRIFCRIIESLQSTAKGRTLASTQMNNTFENRPLLELPLERSHKLNFPRSFSMSPFLSRELVHLNGLNVGDDLRRASTLT